MTVSIDSQKDGGYKYVYGLGLAYAVDSLGNPLTQHTDGLGGQRPRRDRQQRQRGAKIRERRVRHRGWIGQGATGASGLQSPLNTLRARSEI